MREIAGQLTTFSIALAEVMLWSLTYFVRDPQPQMVQAILNRWRFEVGFCAYQNQLGARFGEARCRERNSYDERDGNADGRGENRG